MNYVYNCSVIRLSVNSKSITIAIELSQDLRDGESEEKSSSASWTLVSWYQLCNVSSA